jgi:hypothetical protein
MATQVKECRLCHNVQDITCFRVITEKRKDRCVSEGKYPCSWCRSCEKQRALASYYKNRDVNIAKNKKYKDDNKDKINETRRAYSQNKMKDHVERLKRNMKCLLCTKIKKTKHSAEYLGTDVAIIVKWLEWNFDEGMTWDNHGTHWQIDHTIAINLFDLNCEEDRLICFNWKNMMPLTAHRNQKKSDTLFPYRVFHQERRLREFFAAHLVNDDLTGYLKAYTKCLATIMNKHATYSNCGNPLRAQATTLVRKLSRGTRLIAVPNGKKA